MAWSWHVVRERATELLAGGTLSTADYPGVLVPLDEAFEYSHTARTGTTGEAAYTPANTFEHEAEVGDAGETTDEGGKRRRSGGGSGDFDHDDHDHDDEAQTGSEYTIAGLRRYARQADEQARATPATLSEYEVKSKLINKAIQDIGMGRYNWQLFFLCGFGWFADNLWMQGVSLVLPSLSAEFGVAEKTVRYTTSALFLGLCFGSFFWGIGSDVMGRRIAFNCTLLITGVFGTLVAFAGSWGLVCVLVAALGFGVGGNLPVDGALFLEFLPDSDSSLLTLLSVWWPVGQLVSSLLAWLLIAGPWDTDWRTFVTTIGMLTFAMFFVRCCLFRVFESPKFMLSRGRQGEAVAIVHGLAFCNGTKTWLTSDILDAVAEGTEGASASYVGYAATSADADADADDDADDDTEAHGHAASEVALVGHRGSGRRAAHDAPAKGVLAVVRAKLQSFSGARLRPLFRERQLAMATALVWFVWATIGMGYPLFNAFLPQYLSHGGSDSADSNTEITARDEPASVTYRNFAITSIVGVPGSLLAAYTVDNPSPFLGRRGTLACSTLVSAVFLYLFATFGRSPATQLFFSCVEAFAQNIMYGVLYAFTPEIFPAPVRGAGAGVASFLNRITGLVAPVIAATLPGNGATGPIYLSAALILSAFFGMVLIPIETRGRQRL